MKTAGETRLSHCISSNSLEGTFQNQNVPVCFLWLDIKYAKVLSTFKKQICHICKVILQYKFMLNQLPAKDRDIF